MPKEYEVPRGFRDFPPEMVILRKKVIGRIEEIFKRYGFDPIETPAVELWETLKGKYGEEAEKKLIFRFSDPFDNIEYGLRYDLTVPLARFVASYSIPMPFKRYHIGPVWRRELKPRKGRYREFLQCDVDIVGGPHPEADAEIVNIINDVIQEFGFRHYRIKLNDRRILAGFFEEQLELGDPAKVLAVYRTIDKLDKFSIDQIREELKELGLTVEKIEKIEEIISIRGKPDEKLDEVLELSKSQNVEKGVEHLREMLNFVDKREYLFLDLSMVRGLDYYTGPIFETVVDEPNIGSLTGGGRYDNLIKLYGGPDLPATGTTIGVERLIDAGLELGIFSLDEKTYTRVFIATFTRDTYVEGWRLANELRSAGIPVQVDLMRRSVSKQQEYVRKKGIPIIVYLGKKELASGKITIFVRETEERLEVPIKDFVETLKGILKKV
ncbi:MAG: histidine--tRNA ligase [Candidatus Njordarchaeia archaeon]